LHRASATSAQESTVVLRTLRSVRVQIEVEEEVEEEVDADDLDDDDDAWGDA
jgi:hypothetical protein